MQKLAQAYIQLGTNLGERLANLEQARQQIINLPSAILKESSIYETEAWGIKEQPAFLNQVILITTHIQPEELLQAFLVIERKMGRERIHKWRERLIDIDILFYNDLILKTEILTIPHPFIQKRNFVLAPLQEIAPDFIHPQLKKTMWELWSQSPDQSTVKRL